MYEIRPMSFGELLDTGLRIIRDHPGLLFALALVVYLPLGVVQGLAAQLEAPQDGEGPIVSVLAAYAVVLLFMMIMSPVLSAAITHAVAEFFLSRTATFGSSLRLGFSLFLPLVGTTMLYSMMILAVIAATGAVAGLLAGVLGAAWPVFVIAPLGIYLFVRLFVSYLLVWQVMVIENDFGMSALRRSSALMKGYSGRGLGVMVVAGIISAVVSAGPQLLGFAFPFIGGFLSGILQSFGVIFTAAVSVVLYFDLRCRKESFDLEHLADLVDRRTAAATPAT